MSHQDHAIVLAGIPQSNLTLFHRIRFSVGDPTVYIQLPNGKRILILRDIEIDRAKQTAHADEFYCNDDFAPKSGLSGDRETATAQALVECLTQNGIHSVTSDRTLPLIYAHHIQEAGINITCDTELGVLERRSKDESELDHLRKAQKITEDVMRYTCELIFATKADAQGQLIYENKPLTSEYVRSLIDIAFLLRGASSPHGSIVAGGPVGADCHHRGTGVLHTSQPIIIDLFPHIQESGYNGDCTRTICHGDIPDQLMKMYDAVIDAKNAAQNVTKAGVTGEDVHRAAINQIQHHGYSIGLAKDSDPDSHTTMAHGTGHGIGLDVHEPPLLDMNGPELVIGDVITIEPGLYSKSIGGIRIEDMVAVTKDGYENFNTLPMSLHW